MLFSETEIAERYCDLFEIADGFCDDYNELLGGPPLEIDPALLYLVVVAAYDDISRYKAYHLADPAMQRANALKRAAYLTRWIVHFSPLIFPKAGHVTGDSEAPQDGRANVLFAMHVALSNIQLHAQNTGVTSVKPIELSTNIAYSLMYDLLYRQLTSDGLILIFEIAAEIAAGREVLV